MSTLSAPAAPPRHRAHAYWAPSPRPHAVVACPSGPSAPTSARGTAQIDPRSGCRPCSGGADVDQLADFVDPVLGVAELIGPVVALGVILRGPAG
jgi:hypothetical protein